MDGRDGVDALMVVEVGEFDDEEELFDFDLILFAVEAYDLVVEGIGDAAGGAAGGEDVVEEGEVEGVAFGLTGSDVGEAVKDVVGAIFFFDGHAVEVALAIWELAFLADGDYVLHELRLGEEGCGEDEATSLDGDYIGAVDVRVDIGNQLVEGLFVGEEGEDVDEVDAGLGKVGIMIDDVLVIHEGSFFVGGDRFDRGDRIDRNYIIIGPRG